VCGLKLRVKGTERRLVHKTQEEKKKKKKKRG